MSIMRVHKTKNFTVMSNYHFKEKGMSLKAKGLLSLMLSLPDDWNYSISGLVRLSKDGKDSVMSALAELEKFGYLTRVRLQNDKGQFSGVEYNIYESPQEQNPISENQNSEKENADNTNSEKPRQLNTNSIKDSFNKEFNESNTYSEELAHVEDEELKELYLDYAEMRNSIEHPLTNRGMKMLIQRCERIANNAVHIQKILLEAAIINNWKNVYPPSEKEMENIQQSHINELKQFYGL